PSDRKEVELSVGRRKVQLKNLQRVLWPQSGARRRDLLQYYVDVAAALFPHVSDRAIALRRYPKSLADAPVLQKTPESRPDWIDTCAVEDGAAGIAEYPVVNALASLLWIVNLGCIDLNHCQATSDDSHRPDHLIFELNPPPGGDFEQTLQAALLVRRALE